jgi:hypothetical protein
MRAPRYSALRISTRWRSPTDRLPTRASGSTCRPKLLRHRQQLGARGAAAREGLPQRLGAQHHVVQHAQVVGQREVLVHHADARRQRRRRVAGRQRLAKDLDVAGVGHVVPEQDRHQRALARTVLAQQRQHLAALPAPARCVVGHQRAEALGDASQGENRLGHADPLLGRGLGLAVVHLDGELAVEDVLLFGLDLGNDVGRHLLLEGAQRASEEPLCFIIDRGRSLRR